MLARRGRPGADPRALLASAVRRAGRPAILELFAGSGRLAAACRRAPATEGHPAFEWDVRHGAAYDVLAPAAGRQLRGWLRSGLLAALWMGTPCSSFSRVLGLGAGPPALRSAAAPAGLPGLSPAWQSKVDAGNRLATLSAGLLLLCRRLGVPAAIENPATSFIWQHPAFVSAAAAPGVRKVTLDFCRFGAPWRKRTTLMFVHMDLNAVGLRCCGRGVCDVTGRPHTQLMGKDQHGRFRTAVAEAYPPRLATAIAEVIGDAVLARRGRAFAAAWEKPPPRGT